jgi:hypothetical protein
MSVYVRFLRTLASLREPSVQLCLVSHADGTMHLSRMDVVTRAELAAWEPRLRVETKLEYVGHAVARVERV